MKTALIAALLISLSCSADACSYFGVEGQFNLDGQSITSRQPIALKEQAKRYGGYQEAAAYIEANRREVMRNDQISRPVKDQIDADLAENAKQLRCWAAACSKATADPACRPN